jgi:short-subunit dehydrogenase
MATKLKKIADQVMVVTGASSGIGLATAEMAAAKGASLILAARSERTLTEIVGRLTKLGAQAMSVPCDVADFNQVRAVADAAVKRFGRIDTWVNNAGLGMYGRAEETEEQDARKLFDVNFWGAVHGCRAALPHLRANGGALITVGSEVSDSYAPLMSMYVASKHAIKGYIDVLRVEVENIDKAPISITLIEPTAVDTPFPQHAKNYTRQEPRLPPPTIQPTDVAKAILEAATKPTREKKVGVMSKISTAVAKILPGMADRMSAKRLGDLTHDEPPRNPDGALSRSSESVGVAGQTKGNGGKEK